ncbi:unnamed protein product [Adineta steineri]|uniref:NHL repeat containing protein n=1 Tax=Adineta steineri TaxID=433720 RepID=A0A819AT26_9BILA|nr:unnamed protein product [Adineta steineri]
MTCTECTCAALMNNAIAWNCIADNNTCQLISNNSLDISQFEWMTNASCFFQKLPPAFLLTTTSTSISTTLTSTSTSTASTSASTSTSTSASTSTSTSASTSTSTSASTSTTSTSTTTTNTAAQWNSTAVTVAGSAGGTSGLTASLLSFPYILRLDSSNALYISDYGNNRIQKWILGDLNGTTIAGLANGTAGTSLNTLKSPVGLALDSNDNMYVVDKLNSRVTFWPNGASSGSVVAGTGTAGSGNNQLNRPNAIELVESTGTLYISDMSNYRIIQYLSNASSGTVVAGGNGEGLGITQLYSPFGFTFDSSTNSLVIADYYANHVVRWVLGASNWILLAGSLGGTSGNSATLLHNPVAVALDQYGNLYVSDTGNHRIQFFLAGQSSGTTLAGVNGSPGTSATQLNQPYGILLDSQLNLYVADYNNNRVQKFSRY